jgi:hypothetical protein
MCRDDVRVGQAVGVGWPGAVRNAGRPDTHTPVSPSGFLPITSLRSARANLPQPQTLSRSSQARGRILMFVSQKHGGADGPLAFFQSNSTSLSRAPPPPPHQPVTAVPRPHRPQPLPLASVSA